MDYFTLLDEPRRPWLDPDALKAKFVARSAECHPDRFHNEGPSEKAAAQAKFTELNEAYNALREPKSRLAHLLELETGEGPARQAPAEIADFAFEAGRILREAGAFAARLAAMSSPLAKSLAMRETLEWREKVGALQAQIQLRHEKLLAELKDMNPAWDAAPPPGSPDRAAALPLERLRRLAGESSFLRRAAEQAGQGVARLTAD